MGLRSPRPLDSPGIHRRTVLRPLIVIGDRTSHGGVVIGSAMTTDTHGKPLARVGDRVACPRKGHGITTIFSGDPTMLVDGASVARHGDLCSCGAALIASQQLSVTEDDSSDHGALKAKQSRFAGLFTELVPPHFEYDIHFLVRDELSGRPLPGVSYSITLEDGKSVTGVTDQDGLTERIGANTSQLATLEVHHHGHESNGATDADSRDFACRC